MKYLSLLLIFLVMNLTWAWVQRPTSIAEIVHAGIQEDLKRVIANYIRENLPSSRNLEFERFWTEAITSHQVKATFSYSFKDDAVTGEPTAVTIEGYAILNKTISESGHQEFWSFDELYILNNQIEFQDGLILTPNDNNF